MAQDTSNYEWPQEDRAGDSDWVDEDDDAMGGGTNGQDAEFISLLRYV
jgi:hypothetical protein